MTDYPHSCPKSQLFIDYLIANTGLDETYKDALAFAIKTIM